MKPISRSLAILGLAFLFFTSAALSFQQQQQAKPPANEEMPQADKPAAAPPVKTEADSAAPAVPFGFADFSRQSAWDKRFLAVPDPKLAEEHLRILTAEPHIAGSPEDKKTADYVARKFREAGLETEIVEYNVWLNYPSEISVDMTAPAGVAMHGPTPEKVVGDKYQDDPRVTPGFNGSSPSGDVEADIVYANYGRPEDFKTLEKMKVDVRGKIVLVRYGSNFRGVKTYVAQEHGAAGVLIYSDPIDDGYFKGDMYPKGPWRPETAVQRGSINFMFKFPGDPTTPGIASVASLPMSSRTPPERSADMPTLLTTPLSYHDARPILENLGGPASPREWQGALPFTYHLGPGPARVKIHLKQDYAYRTIWNVIGKVRGADLPDEWVVAGNHRDAWVYGAVDPNSGTAAMLETVHGIGALLKAGWKPRRTIVFGSWDAEEQGLIGSTEWGEEHERELADAAAYFNVDVAVAGPNFSSSAVPSLKRFVRESTRFVPSPKGGTVYSAWKARVKEDHAREAERASAASATPSAPAGNGAETEVPVGDLGSGSDYTVFIQRLGVPSNDISSGGDYGVYHSVFDNFAWFTKFGDPTFVYEQEMARVFGIEVLHMASADVLPLDYQNYGREITSYLDKAQKKAATTFGSKAPSFVAAADAARRFTAAGERLLQIQQHPPADTTALNQVLRRAERAFLIPEGLPNRPWFRHAIYAPGEYTGYAAVVVPGVNEAIDANDLARTTRQLSNVVAALERANQVLESYSPAKR